MTKLRESITGTYTHEDISKLKWPVAWSGEPDRKQEEDLAALVDEAREALRDCPDAIAVEIERGVIVATVMPDDDLIVTEATKPPNSLDQLVEYLRADTVGRHCRRTEETSRATLSRFGRGTRRGFSSGRAEPTWK